MKIRKWKIKEDNIAFIPRGLGTGLSLRTEKKIIKLDRSDSFQSNFSYNVENFMGSSFSEEQNLFVPSPKNNDYVILNVGAGNNTKKLFASCEENNIVGSLDLIKVSMSINCFLLF